MTDAPTVRKTNGRFRIRVGLGVTILGFIIYLLGAEPGIFLLDRSPVVGFVQIATFLVGLGFICLGGYISLAALWNGGPEIDRIGYRFAPGQYRLCNCGGMRNGRCFWFWQQQLSPNTHLWHISDNRCDHW